MTDAAAPISAEASAALLSTLADEDLLQRVGEMAYAQQMAAAEGLAVDDATRLEADALAAEVARRGLAA